LERVALSANKPKPTATPLTTPKRGRPKGSRNRPKPAEQPLLIKPAALRVSDAARYISVSVTTIRRLINRGELEVRRYGSLLLVLVRSLDAFLESGA
jgi:excisionase family DNA binding protein